MSSALLEQTYGVIEDHAGSSTKHSMTRMSFRRRDEGKQGKSQDRNRDRDRDRDRDREDDDRQRSECRSIKSSQAQIKDACSDEQFLSSMLPLLQSLEYKKNISARINIQKVLFDAVDDMEDATSDQHVAQCCRPPMKKSSACQNRSPDQASSRGSQHQRRTS